MNNDGNLVENTQRAAKSDGRVKDKTITPCSTFPQELRIQQRF
jgi:hypothetical protein